MKKLVLSLFCASLLLFLLLGKFAQRSQDLSTSFKPVASESDSSKRVSSKITIMLRDAARDTDGSSLPGLLYDKTVEFANGNTFVMLSPSNHGRELPLAYRD